MNGFLSKFLNKVSNFIQIFKSKLTMNYEYNPSLIVNHERVEELIDYTAKQIVNRGLETPALFYLETLKYYGYPFVNLNLLPMAPFLDFLGINLYEFMDVLRERQNVERLMSKIRQLKLLG